MSDKDPEDIEISDVMRKALDDLETAVLEFEIEDATVKRIKGTWTLHMRTPGNA